MFEYIKLNNFRNYQEDVFVFKKGINIIIGPNGSGKTNLLEAIYCISRFSSFRTKLDNLIRNKTNKFILSAEYNNQQKTLIYNKESKTKQYYRNQKKVSISKQDQIPIVLFEPNFFNLNLVSNEQKRSFIDDLILQIKPSYSKTISQYKKTLLQRNKLLKKGQTKDLFPWNIKICQLSQEIINNRLDIITEINQKISKRYNKFSNNFDKINLKYKSLINLENYSSNLLKQLEDNFLQEKIIGHTLFGPHKDEIVFLFNNNNVKSFLSQGENRSIVLSLKLTEKEILEDKTNKLAIFLFDDLFSELDGNRRTTILKQIDINQTFITTTDIDLVINNLQSKFNILPINKKKL